MKRGFLIVAAVFTGVLASYFMTQRETAMAESITPEQNAQKDEKKGTATATFGTGCFWCTEACFQQLKGVVSVTSGYTGGTTKNPTYEDICSGETGHAEAVQVVYDPKVITYPELLEVFWKIHDPTTLNRQGNDVGTQYRSAIFTHNEEQKKLAEEYKLKLDKSGAFKDPIVTEVTPASMFYPAEKYHQNYYNLNSNKGYCQYVVKPKLDKLKEVFKDKLREKK